MLVRKAAWKSLEDGVTNILRVGRLTYRSFPSSVSLCCRTWNVQIHPLGPLFGLLQQNELATGIAALCGCRRAYLPQQNTICLPLRASKICWLRGSLWWDWQRKLSPSIGASCRENGSLSKIMGSFVLGTTTITHLLPSEKSLMEREVAHVGQWKMKRLEYSWLTHVD